MNYTEAGIYIYNGEQKEFHYATYASYAERVAFIKDVSNNLFVDGNYISLLKDKVFDYLLVSMFTDIDLSSNLDEFDAFNEETRIVSRLTEELSEKNYNLIDTLKNAVDDNIEYRKNVPQQTQDNISTAITDLIKAFTVKVKAIDTNVDLEQAMGFIKKLSDSDINAENLVNAYLGSDSFKNNVASVVDAKNEQIKELQDKVNSVTAKNVVADKSDKVVPVKKGKK